MFLAVIVVVGAVPRAYQLSQRAIWFDEAFFWRLSQRPVSELIAGAREDNHPPLYPLLLKAWCGVFGTSLGAMRSLSVVFSTLTIIGMFSFAREAFGGRDRTDGAREPPPAEMALFTAALVATSVFQTRWAWDVKNLAMGTALAAFSSWALFRALRVTTHAAWVTYAALALAFLYTHYYALASVFAQGAFVAGWLLVKWRFNLARLAGDRAFWSWLAALAVMMAGWAPWLPSFLHQHDRDRAEGLRPRLKMADLVDAPFQMFFEPED
ncbi:MAG TPA: glycosyltransferase family 39 protein, partial [Pirellulales bacterium]|nr:glycosyltransferase family 39 protein [Pirellulales bacterium]